MFEGFAFMAKSFVFLADSLVAMGCSIGFGLSIHSASLGFCSLFV
jgi:hypothetical protein